MSWLTKRYDPTNPNADADGMVAIKKTTRGKPDQLFPDDWKQHKSSVDNSNYWDVINNPLYEAAALANGINWDQWVAESTAKLGNTEDYKAAISYIKNHRSPKGNIRGSTAGVSAAGVLSIPYFVDTEKSENAKNEAWENLTPFQQELANSLPNTAGTGSQGPLEAVGQLFGGQMSGHASGVSQNLQGVGVGAIAAGHAMSTMAGVLSGKGEPLKNWGFDRHAFGAVAEDLDTMHEWLTKTIKTHSLQDAPIIDRGPIGSDYGIDGDIWEHYGLDKPPEPPKAMDIHYDFNLLDVKPSTAYYSTPYGYPELDLSTESVPYGATAYAEFMGDKGMDVPLTHQKVVEGYQHDLGRDPSRDESLNWQSHSEDEKFFTDSFPNDPLVHEVKDSVLNKAYKARFGRLPSDAERTNWKGTGKSLDEMKEGIANHPDLEEQPV